MREVVDYIAIYLSSANQVPVKHVKPSCRSGNIDGSRADLTSLDFFQQGGHAFWRIGEQGGFQQRGFFCLVEPQCLGPSRYRYLRGQFSNSPMFQHAVGAAADLRLVGADV